MIGVYDSGFGGLSVLRALRAALPSQDFCYLGDSGRAPYGGRDAEVILDLAEQCVERLFEEGCRLIVVACHTVSCVGLRHLQRRYCMEPSGPERRVLGVTIPAAEAAVACTPPGSAVVWVGTARTVASRTAEIEIHKLAPALPVYGVAAPLLAPMVEEGLGDPADPEGMALARGVIRRYLRPAAGLVAPTVVLGCTHYPLLREAFEAEIAGLWGGAARLLDPAPVVAERLVDWLRRHPGYTEQGQGRLQVLCSGDPAAFARQGERFLKERLAGVQHIREEGGRLALRAHGGEAVGQIMRYK